MNKAHAIKADTATVAEGMARAVENLMKSPFYTLKDLPDYVPEEQNPDILVKGRWLERGGSAFWISTAGTGKTILSQQLALCFAEGKPFAGLAPLRPLRVLMFQTEDSPTRLGIDRDDITAELSELYPEINWRATWKKVSIAKNMGKTGAEFLSYLDETILTLTPQTFDLIILNPFFAFIGGDISQSAYVTPFLRGGEINHGKTTGLQYILEKHRVGVLCFHHTNKPPNDKELKSWFNSAFPEYQGAGSADITNWGRSFITMFRLPSKPDVVCLTAGKNGGELGWQRHGGAWRHYLANSRGEGVTGRGRHAWRELDADELAEITSTVFKADDDDVQKLVAALRENPMTHKAAKEWRAGDGKAIMSVIRFNTAWKEVADNLDKYGLARVDVDIPVQKKPSYVGEREAAMAAAKEAAGNWRRATSR